METTWVPTSLLCKQVPVVQLTALSKAGRYAFCSISAPNNMGGGWSALPWFGAATHLKQLSQRIRPTSSTNIRKRTENGLQIMVIFCHAKIPPSQYFLNTQKPPSKRYKGLTSECTKEARVRKAWEQVMKIRICYSLTLELAVLFSFCQPHHTTQFNWPAKSAPESFH